MCEIKVIEDVKVSKFKFKTSLFPGGVQSVHEVMFIVSQSMYMSGELVPKETCFPTFRRVENFRKASCLTLMTRIAFHLAENFAFEVVAAWNESCGHGFGRLL